MTRFEYHEEDDVAVFEYGNYDHYERSVDIANFVVDLSDAGEFLGLEIIGATERLPLNKKELSEIEEVEIMVKEDGDSMMVTIVLKQDNEKTSLNLPVTEFTGQPA